VVEYIDVESITGNEAAYCERLEADLRAAGYRVERQAVEDDRWNVIALPTNSPRIVFCTHVDVVPPHVPALVADGAIWGRGACDTKGGLVAMMAAADRLDPNREFIGFLLVVGEEVNHIGAIVSRSLDIRPDAIILCEPTTGNLVRGQKGLLKIELTSEGEAAHSAFPHLGKDAVGPLLDSLEALRKADYPGDPILGETSLNIGVLEAGVAANVIPPHARAELVYRAATDPDALYEQVHGLCTHGVSVRDTSRNPPIVLNTVDGFPLENIAFNTDAFYLRDLGPVYLLGPGDIRVAHRPDEHITIDDLEKGVDDYVRLVEALSK